MKHKYRIVSLAVIVCTVLSLVGCELPFILPDSADDSGIQGGAVGDRGDSGEVVFPDGGVDILPDGWDNSTPVGATPVYLMRGDSVNLTECIDGALPAQGVTFESRCPAVASVSGYELTGESVGRTEVKALYKGDVIATFSVTVEFMISTSGFNFKTDLKDGQVHKVNSVYEANRILDYAIAQRYGYVTIDFSGVSESFDVSKDFDLDIELGSHASLKIMYYTESCYKAEFAIVYNANAASDSTPLTEENTYIGVQSANMIARRAFAETEGVGRADDFNAFPIYTSGCPELEVYNSEELWWAVEQGYLPVFPMENTKAELFFERAKMILREIIHDGMSEREKVIAIYEYLVDAISYDYDAYERANEVNLSGDENAVAALKNDKCYYLEGVFEKGRAVCDGKTKAFVLLCGIEGISCLRASGAALDGGSGHAWNYVYLENAWRLVDTTEADARFESDSDLAKFFGAKTETIGYSAFLKPVDYLKSSYEYSAVWSKIEEEGRGEEIDYFDTDIPGTEYDFVINSSTEAKAIFDKLMNYGIEDKFTLTFVSSASGSKVYDYFSSARKQYGAQMKVFTLMYGEEKIYIAVFSLEK